MTEEAQLDDAIKAAEKEMERCTKNAAQAEQIKQKSVGNPKKNLIAAIVNKAKSFSKK